MSVGRYKKRRVDVSAAVSLTGDRRAVQPEGAENVQLLVHHSICSLAFVPVYFSQFRRQVQSFCGNCTAFFKKSQGYIDKRKESDYITLTNVSLLPDTKGWKNTMRKELYPRTGDGQIVYLKDAVTVPNIKQPVVLAVLFVLMFIGGCFFVKANQAKEFEKNDYGVFLNADASSLERFKMYETIVIDAQYFTKRDIELLHQNGTVVYTYLNIGSIENFREYYTTYAELAIGEYEHWEEEEWVDVANPDWQKFIGQLSQELYEKGVDGFFIDNCDVYDYDPHESIFEGITAILQNMMTFGKAVIINGGDTYVAEYRERYGAIDQIMTGVNQESVWSSIDFDSGTFREQTSETRDYFCKYLETCKADGVEVYLLEYTTNQKLIQKIKEYCKEQDFHFYISSSLELR